MFTFCVQTVLLLQPHKLEVSFTTLQWLCRWCTDPAYHICPQCVVARGRPWFWSSMPPILVACPWSCSPLHSSLDCLVATSLVGWNLVSQLSGIWQSHEANEPKLHPAETWCCSYLLLSVNLQIIFERSASKNIVAAKKHSTFGKVIERKLRRPDFMEHGIHSLHC